ARARAAALRERRKGLPHDRRRLHRGPPPLGRDRRDARRLAPRRRAQRGRRAPRRGEADVSRAEGSFEIVNELGLHARAATKLVQLASRHVSEVELEKDGQRANAKSVMGVLLLCGAKGTRVTVHAEGEDAAAAVDAIGALIAARFGEER